MKLITIAIAASVASAALTGCTNHGSGFDTNAAEHSFFPGDEGRRPGETNGEAAARVGKEVYVFQPDRPQVAKHVPADTANADINATVASSKKQTPVPAERMDTAAPVTAEETEIVDTTYYQTTTASSVEEAPKSKKELRKEKRDARKAKKNN